MSDTFQVFELKTYAPRAMEIAVLNSRLRDAKTEPHPVFGIHVPVAIPGVPADVLNPRNTWQDKNAYDEKAQALWAQFEKNYDLLINNPGAVGGSGG